MIEATADAIEMLRDLIIARLKAARIPERSIAKVLGMAQSTVNERYRGMPRSAVEGLDFDALAEGLRGRAARRGIGPGPGSAKPSGRRKSRPRRTA